MFYSIPLGRLIAQISRSASFRIGIACILVIYIGCWGMFRELALIETSVIKSQMSEVRSNAERTVIHLEQDLFRGRGRELSDILRESAWLVDLWERTQKSEPIRAFRAIVDTRNQIIAHTDIERIGKMALPVPRDRSFTRQRNERVDFRTDPELAGDKPYIEIRVPIRKFRGTAGYYVSGIASDWIASKVYSEQRGAIITWTIVISCATLIVAITGIALYRLAGRASQLEQELNSAETRRLTELSMLLVGMAHEVRNPLNCIRLNLHTTEKVFLGDSHCDRSEVMAMLSESAREVDRVNEIISQLLGLARQEKAPHEYSNAAEEIESAIHFFRTTFDQMKIRIQFENRASNVFVAIDRLRLRQILVNLMTNAKDALPQGGEIEIELDSDIHSASLRIADSGGGVDENLKKTIFEPFITTRDTGTGLGLAVVKSIVEQVGGQITCERSAKLGGAEFLLHMPRSSHQVPSMN